MAGDRGRRWDKKRILQTRHLAVEWGLIGKKEPGVIFE